MEVILIQTRLDVGMESANLCLCKACSEDNQSENVMKQVESECSTRSKARSIAFASVKKIEDLFGRALFNFTSIYCIQQQPQQNRHL